MKNRPKIPGRLSQCEPRRIGVPNNILDVLYPSMFSIPLYRVFIPISHFFSLSMFECLSLTVNVDNPSYYVVSSKWLFVAETRKKTSSLDLFFVS